MVVLLKHRSLANRLRSMLLPLLLIILAYYYFMRRLRRDENADDGTMLLPGSRFDNWELRFEE